MVKTEKVTYNSQPFRPLILAPPERVGAISTIPISRNRPSTVIRVDRQVVKQDKPLEFTVSRMIDKIPVMV